MSVTHPVFGFAKMETDATAEIHLFGSSLTTQRGIRVRRRRQPRPQRVWLKCLLLDRGGQNGKIGPGDGFLVLDPDLLTYRGGMTT